MGSVVRLCCKKNAAATKSAQPQPTLDQPSCDSPPLTQIQQPSSVYAEVPMGPPDLMQMSLQMPIQQPLGPTGPPVANFEPLATNPIFLRALFSFEGQTSDDLSFMKGDRLYLLKQCANLDFNCNTSLLTFSFTPDIVRAATGGTRSTWIPKKSATYPPTTLWLMMAKFNLRSTRYKFRKL